MHFQFSINNNTIGYLKKYNHALFFSGFILLLLFAASCEKKYETFRDRGGSSSSNPPNTGSSGDTNSNDLVEGVDYFLPKIDLSNWKVTLPVGNPTEVHPPEILDYSTNDLLQDFMYNDSTDGSLVFYTYPGASTANSSYSRTELRELMDGGNGKVNWTFAEGGRMKGTLSVPEISKDAGGNPHRTIIMQIHGRLTDAQKNLIGARDNNAPPVLKLQWYKGLIRVHTKVLKDLNASATEILETDAWGNEASNFLEEVGHDKFTLEIIALDGRMEVILNDNESKVFEDIHMEKWGVFENYFKAGNYLGSKEENAFAKVKYYDLEVTH